MTPLFVEAIKSATYPEIPTFARHSALCAARYSGCEVFPMSTYSDPGWMSVPPEHREHLDSIINLFQTRLGVVPRELYAILRWFVIQKMARSMQFPIITIDWDCLVFDNILEHFMACGVEGSDYGATFDREISQTFTSPIIIMRRDVIDAFVEHATNEIDEWVPWFSDNDGHLPGGGDMCMWERFRKKNNAKAHAINSEVNGKLFDGNIVLDRDRYEHDGIFGKKIVKRGSPHFVRKDGTLVKAVGVHCFMAWKNRTSELL